MLLVLLLKLYFDCNPSSIVYFILSILLLLSKPKKESKKRTKYDIAWYKQIYYLRENIIKSPFYYLIRMSDEIMFINKNEIPDRRARVVARKIFLHDLSIMVVRGSFYVFVYKYAWLNFWLDSCVQGCLRFKLQNPNLHLGHFSAGSNILIKARKFLICWLRQIAKRC